jgi:hypothetical protein
MVRHVVAEVKEGAVAEILVTSLLRLRLVEQVGEKGAAAPTHAGDDHELHTACLPVAALPRDHSGRRGHSRAASALPRA